MKNVGELNPNYAPVYAAALYPGLAKIFQHHGYALAVHGSCARDFDLIAVPWAERVSPPSDVLGAVMKEFAVTYCDGGAMRNHGRLCYSISIGFGECAIDLSFFPHAPSVVEKLSASAPLREDSP